MPRSVSDLEVAPAPSRRAAPALAASSESASKEADDALGEVAGQGVDDELASDHSGAGPRPLPHRGLDLRMRHQPGPVEALDHREGAHQTVVPGRGQPFAQADQPAALPSSLRGACPGNRTHWPSRRASHSGSVRPKTHSNSSLRKRTRRKPWRQQVAAPRPRRHGSRRGNTRVGAALRSEWRRSVAMGKLGGGGDQLPDRPAHQVTLGDQRVSTGSSTRDGAPPPLRTASVTIRASISRASSARAPLPGLSA